MPEQVRIALDAMGGDHGPAVVIPGAALSLARHPDSEFLLFGDARVIEPLLASPPRPKAASRVVHTEVAVAMDDKPSQALRHGRWKSSMWLAIEAVKRGEADVAVSAGNTGALMAMAKFSLKTMAGIERPAIAAILADAARRIDRARCRGIDRRRRRSISSISPSWAAPWRASCSIIERPTVGLLNIGVEEIKGLEQVRKPAQILRERSLPHSNMSALSKATISARAPSMSW